MKRWPTLVLRSPRERNPENAAGEIHPLEGSTIILTGASSGIGESFARGLSAAGAKLVLSARREGPVRSLASELNSAEVVVGDLADPATLERLTQVAVERYGRIDGLVNNAGLTNLKPALKESPDEIRRIIEVDLTAPLLLCCPFANVMRSQGDGGAIVNVTSAAALRSQSWMACASYVAAKSGLGGVTRELADQWGRYGIRVNAIAPGPFTTEMSGEEWLHGRPAEILRERVPLGRPGRVEELNETLHLLLSSGSSYITGQTIVVDGGMTITG